MQVLQELITKSGCTFYICVELEYYSAGWCQSPGHICSVHFAQIGVIRSTCVCLYCYIRVAARAPNLDVHGSLGTGRKRVEDFSKWYVEIIKNIYRIYCISPKKFSRSFAQQKKEKKTFLVSKGNTILNIHIGLCVLAFGDVGPNAKYFCGAPLLTRMTSGGKTQSGISTNGF